MLTVVSRVRCPVCRGLLCVALQLSLFDAAAAPPNLFREEPATRLVDVHDVVSADSVLVHHPAQLDEEPVRVGVLLLRAVELFQALGGLLAAQAHAMQELSDPPLAGTHVVSLCVEPFVRQASDRHRAEAQDVGHVRFQGVGEISGHAILQLLQNTNDLATLRCMTAEIAELSAL